MTAINITAANGSASTPHWRRNSDATPDCPVNSCRKVALRSRCSGWAISMATTTRAQPTAASVKRIAMAALTRRESTVKASTMTSAIRGKSSARSANNVGLQVSSGPLGAAASRASITVLPAYSRSASTAKLRCSR